MDDSSLSRDEIRAAAAVHNELGPEYQDAVLDSFLEKIDRQVGNRIEAQLATLRPPAAPSSDRSVMDRKRSQLGAMAVGSVLAGLASGVAVAWSVHYPGSSPAKALALAWAILAVAYIAYAWRLRRR
jgi:lysozyme family protein